MTRRTLRRWAAATIGYFVLLLVVAYVAQSRAVPVYLWIKDLLGALIAIPGALLATCLQRRTSFLQQLRDYWSKTVRAVQAAIQYTHLEGPSHAQMATVLLDLSVAIEEYRAVFSDIHDVRRGEDEYPFESLMAIHALIREMGYGAKADGADRARIRESILSRWRSVRDTLLREFDRELPTYYQPADPIGSTSVRATMENRP